MKRFSLIRLVSEVSGVFFLLGMVACHGSTPELDQEAPQIDVMQPLGGHSQAAGTPLVIEAHITENDALHGWEIIAINQGTGRQVGYHHGHEHTAVLQLRDTLLITGAMDCRLLIRADDHTGNSAEIETLIHLIE